MPNQNHNSTFDSIFNVNSSNEMLPYFVKSWSLDPKHVIFQLARYKFISKMLSGDLIEVGCGDGYGMPLVLESASSITGIDIVETAINSGEKYYSDKNNIKLLCTDIVRDVQPDLVKKFDGAYSLDVIEHIPRELEDNFIINISKTLKTHGSLIIGTPNITAQPYASESSAKEHINLFSHERLKDLLLKHFNNVFMFSMNDEVLHVGFQQMSHYIFSLAVSPKEVL